MHPSRQPYSPAATYDPRTFITTLLPHNISVDNFQHI
ncbi:Protein of unknown function [Pyronema omphalodes CBS 100304]|uniref:Uncharacterized protein n=1 Tax=Pyronema omphalodes (strain CBS 100304) TaxID=1076935 RepID=U4L0U1_PYROM|nr:Protein of unknown function [Pyronema omphalodes CBS 100304]